MRTLEAAVVAGGALWLFTGRRDAPYDPSFPRWTPGATFAIVSLAVAAGGNFHVASRVVAGACALVAFVACRPDVYLPDADAVGLAGGYFAIQAACALAVARTSGLEPAFEAGLDRAYALLAIAVAVVQAVSFEFPVAAWCATTLLVVVAVAIAGNVADERAEVGDGV